MHLEPHAALGWSIGVVGSADRKLRNWCVVGAILPDIAPELLAVRARAIVFDVLRGGIPQLTGFRFLGSDKRELPRVCRKRL